MIIKLQPSLRKKWKVIFISKKKTNKILTFLEKNDNIILQTVYRTVFRERFRPVGTCVYSCTGGYTEASAKGKVSTFPVSFLGGDFFMEFLTIFISYLASGMIENNMIIRIFLTIIFSLAGIIGIQATKSFAKEVKKFKRTWKLRIKNENSEGLKAHGTAGPFSIWKIFKLSVAVISENIN